MSELPITKRLVLATLGCCLWLLPAMNCPAMTTPQQLHDALVKELTLSDTEAEHLDAPRITLADQKTCLAIIYRAMGGKPLWVTENGPGSQATIILKYLKKSTEEGLKPAEYAVDQISGLWSNEFPDSLAKLDTLLTYNLMKYVHDMSYSMKLPAILDSADRVPVRESDFDIVGTIKTAAATPDLDGYLSSLAPAHHFYQGLKNALKIYRALPQAHGWQQIPQGKTLHPGEQDDRIQVIYKRMMAPGIPSVARPVSDSYTPSLVNAVEQFQKLNGISPDGVIGPQTLAAMNEPLSSLLKKIVVNMARWRSLSHNLGDKYVVINIADFTLSVYKDNQQVLNFPVIIGKQQNQTPVFSSSIHYIQFNPYWTIPPSIAKNEELRNLLKNPHYLADKHIKLFSGWTGDAIELDSTKIDWKKISPSQMRGFRLRQEPGPWNALGRIKFEFPNPYGVYLHDTPEKELFSRHRRDFSHGCIRLGNPLALALFALDDQNGFLTKEKIESDFYSDKRMTLHLKSGLPIHITYQTAWVDKEGAIHFNRDIYSRDDKLHKALSNYDDITIINPFGKTSNGTDQPQQ